MAADAKGSRRCRNPLARSVVLHLDGVELLQSRRWPREIAVEFLSTTIPPNHVSRSWLVHPEQLWPRSCAERSLHIEHTSGIGLAPRQVAEELAHVVQGHTVYSDGHLMTRRWLGLLFEAAGLGSPSFNIRDVWTLFRRLQADPMDTGPAEQAALCATEQARRASAEALRYGEFARALAARADARRTGVLPPANRPRHLRPSST